MHTSLSFNTSLRRLGFAAAIFSLLGCKKVQGDNYLTHTVVIFLISFTCRVINIFIVNKGVGLYVYSVEISS